MTAGLRGAGLPPPASIDVRLHHALADEIVGLNDMLGELALDLVSNPATLRAHMHSLQSIDRLSQAQLAIAAVLRSSDPVEQRVRAITLESLARALARTLDLCESRLDRNGRTQEWSTPLSAQERIDDVHHARSGQGAVDAAGPNTDGYA